MPRQKGFIVIDKLPQVSPDSILNCGYYGNEHGVGSETNINGRIECAQKR